MSKMFYVVLYGFLGWILERIINLTFMGEWYDNRVLFTFVQPMYGVGVVLTLIGYEIIKERIDKTFFIVLLTIVFGVLFTGLSEWISGIGYEYLYNDILWDYGMTFPSCTYPYVCFIPTTIFGIISAFTVLYIHPHIDAFARMIPKWFKIAIVVIVGIDFLWTYLSVIL